MPPASRPAFFGGIRNSVLTLFSLLLIVHCDEMKTNKLNWIVLLSKYFPKYLLFLWFFLKLFSLLSSFWPSRWANHPGRPWPTGTVKRHYVYKHHSFLDTAFKQTKRNIFLHVIPLRWRMELLSNMRSCAKIVNKFWKSLLTKLSQEPTSHPIKLKHRAYGWPDSDQKYIIQSHFTKFALIPILFAQMNL